jgi:hypothetical protein
MAQAADLAEESACMMLLDTDHITVLQFPEAPKGEQLLRALETAEDRHIATSVITHEEQVDGWLVKLAATPDGDVQVPYHDRLLRMREFFAPWELVRFDEAAAGRFKALRRQ